ncbi:hypothetical protein E2C01_028645 [Portunus trituberculatus]|uniref:Uncharacterized protein n=1 Tax=Portunus trituberculatus TaxID=210409 RepID=A0A5B7EPM9_PORTR|nr:hypothetical protein [Portunus trituberculatus]
MHCRRPANHTPWSAGTFFRRNFPFLKTGRDTASSTGGFVRESQRQGDTRCGRDHSAAHHHAHKDSSRSSRDAANQTQHPCLRYDGQAGLRAAPHPHSAHAPHHPRPNAAFQPSPHSTTDRQRPPFSNRNGCNTGYVAVPVVITPASTLTPFHSPALPRRRLHTRQLL